MTLSIHIVTTTTNPLPTNTEILEFTFPGNHETKSYLDSVTFTLKHLHFQDMMIHICKPNTWDLKSGGIQVQSTTLSEEQRLKLMKNNRLMKCLCLVLKQRVPLPNKFHGT